MACYRALKLCFCLCRCDAEDWKLLCPPLPAAQALIHNGWEYNAQLLQRLRRRTQMKLTFVLMAEPSQVRVSSFTNSSQRLAPLRASKSNKWRLIRSHCKPCPLRLMDSLVSVWSELGRPGLMTASSHKPLFFPTQVYANAKPFWAKLPLKCLFFI